MKHLPVIIPVLLLIIVTAVLNLHIIRLDNGFKVLCKDHMTFVCTYTDMRQMKLGDYFSLPPRIRQYLVREKLMPEYENGVKRNMKEFFSVFENK